MSLVPKIVSLLKKNGVYINKATDKATLLEFLSKLKPVNCGIELIRLGSNNDGGYLIPDDLEGVEYLFSPGVDYIANFEQDCLKKGIRSFMADFSVEKSPIELEGCHFLKKFVGAYNNDKVITMENWVTQSLPKDYDGDLLMQMDIEGAEYETLMATPVDILKRFRIIALEVHNFQKLDNREYFKFVNASFEKLCEYFVPVHVHVNNYAPLSNVNGVMIPPIPEITFLRKDRIRASKVPVHLPHPLDQPNFTDRADVVLPDYWIK